MIKGGVKKKRRKRANKFGSKEKRSTFALPKRKKEDRGKEVYEKDGETGFRRGN